ncbi:MAG: AAA family ATPase [Patescibacteria group bacterium]|mgnify:CR=1 FL=1
MFLKSLELNGFKSFSQKTILEFPAGITAIVGPNGSGKSNIIDAIRWILGEREAKNLRGAKAEDLIFAGTPKKPRVSVAQASLHFDNNSGFFPLDFKEVLVTRRVNRDGNSQYFLNKSEVRLKDVIDFFARSRLGTKGLTIISQGGSDLFVRVSSEERRIMIEEVLGLREYQIKKTEAERKLKNTAINLDKVKAMIGEITPHLRMLKRQTSKWEKRAETEKELKELEDKYFSFKISEIKKSLDSFDPEFAQLSKQIIEKQKELRGLEDEIKKLEPKSQKQENIKPIKLQQDELFSRRSEIQREFGRLEAKIELLSALKSGNRDFKVEEAVNLIDGVKKSLEIGLNNSDFEKLKKVVEDLIAKIEMFLNRDTDSGKEELSELEKLKTDLTKNLVLIEKDLEQLAKAEQEITNNLESFNKNFQKAFEIKEAKKEEINDLESRKNKVLFEKEKLNLKLQDLESQLQQIGRSIKEFSIFNPPAGGQFSINQGELSDIERRMFKLRADLAAIGEIDESLIKEATATETHYNFLTNQSKDLEKALIDLKNLINELSEKIHFEFNNSLKAINEEFNKFFRLMFGGGHAKLKVEREKRKVKSLEEENLKSENKTEINNEEENEELSTGVNIDLDLPKKRITGMDALSGGERSLVSIAALFALISVSPPPFLVLDEVDAALDEQNSRRFSNLIKEFVHKTQFIVVTHNRATMEAAGVLYGITMEEDGVSKVLSLKLDSKM